MITPQRAYGPLRSYGRVKARNVKSRQSELMTERLPGLLIPDGAVDGSALMPGARDIWLEIGFGGGEHLAGQAERNPDVLVLGAEPFLNGMASAVRHIVEAEVQNARLHQGDARDLLARIPDHSLTRIFILFPDPWPKTRHHKRRLIQPEVISQLHRVLKPGGQLRFATDWEDYGNWTLKRVLESGLFDWPVTKADDWRCPPADHLTTRYETKGLGDCAPIWFDFVAR
jgi:tRNA (guanine-N7-)-methyltransferase